MGELSNPEKELEHGTDNAVRRNAELFLTQQLDYCTDLNLGTCMIGIQRYGSPENCIRTIYSKILSGLSSNVSDSKLKVKYRSTNFILPDTGWGCWKI